MTRFIAALSLATLVACDASPIAPRQLTPDSPLAAIVRYEQSFRMFRTACNGELVTLAGMTEITRVTQGDLVSVTLRSEGLGVGQTSAYKIDWTRSSRLMDGTAMHETTTELLRLAGDGATPDTFIRGVSSLTVNPDGTVVVDLDFTDQDCQGRM